MARRFAAALVVLPLLVACSKDQPPVPAAVEAAAPPPSPVEAAPPESTAVLREERTVDVDGVKETWRLEWVRPPMPTCMGDEGLASCPCAAFAFGEVGDLDLVRVRPGSPDERLHLNPLFDEHDAKLRRWLPTAAEQKALKAPSATELQARAVAPIMTFADYDHDGRATEFLLAVDSMPCGHVPTIVVGIDKKNPKLHAFSSAEKPEEPLTLERPGDWDKVKAKVPVDLTEIPCGDHAAEIETHVTVSIDDAGVHANKTTKKCN